MSEVPAVIHEGEYVIRHAERLEAGDALYRAQWLGQWTHERGDDE